MGNLWDWLTGGRAEPERPANDDRERTEADVLEDVHDQIRQDVAAGFEEAEAIVGGVIEMYADEADPEVIEAYARRAVAEEIARHSNEQAAWPEFTDCDRLDAAFATLDDKGIVARQHFTCCGTCGTTEIDREMNAAKEAGTKVRGYTFYHWQDTESAVDGYGVMLYYGGVDEDEGSALAIAREIVAELERNGLRPKWDGSWQRRIEVPLDWKRRRAA